MAFCINCGKSNPETAKFCTSCGATLTAIIQKQFVNPVSQTNSNKTWIVVAIIGTIGLGLGAYFVFSNKKTSKPKPPEITENIPVVPGQYPQASQRFLGRDDVSNLTQYTLRIMRNEIYARHGYIFKNTDMKNYFSSQTWYKPVYDNVNPMLSTLEKKNIELIKQYEEYQGTTDGDFYR